LASDQVAWLLGYFSAVNRLQQAQAAAATAPSTNEDMLRVVYASQTGNSAKLAKRLVAAAGQAGLPAVGVDIADYPAAKLARERNLVLISSTHGEGDPPDSAVEFRRFLFGKRAPRLPDLTFAVLALGDESYANFCKAGADFDRRLAELGATRVLERVDCDVDYEAAVQAWQGKVIEAFKKLARPSAVALAATPPAAAPVEPVYDRHHPFAAPVLERVDLNGRGSGKKTTHLELSIAGSGLRFHPGDALGVLPRNPPGYVAELLALARLPAEAPVIVDGRESSLGSALREIFEVTTVTRSFVKAYAAENGQAELLALLEPGNEEAFQQYVRGREIVDVLMAFPPKALQPQAFVGMLRRLQPRLYSIASSRLAHEDEIHLLVGLTRYESHGRRREGVCSGYLCERLAEDEPVRIYLSENPGFRLPAAKDARVVMIGPGTGVAPFRAFVEEREAQGGTGRNWLFFGDRSFTTDFLYQVEWQRRYKAGVLSRLDLAFSRDQTDKIYVQHRMLEASRELYAWLEDGAHLYVCGDAGRMAADVHEALLAVVAKEGGKDREAAVEYVEGLRAARRYQRDVY
jgi:sulfite reductase (NADPH) flavoprotein alpha-component